MERHALPVRLSAGFNKVEIKVIAKKRLSNYTFVTSKYNRGAAARRGGAPRAPGAFGCGFNKVKNKSIAKKVLSNHSFVTSKCNQW